jgi:hypothetical protein
MLPSLMNKQDPRLKSVKRCLDQVCCLSRQSLFAHTDNVILSQRNVCLVVLTIVAQWLCLSTCVHLMRYAARMPLCWQAALRVFGGHATVQTQGSVSKGTAVQGLSDWDFIVSAASCFSLSQPRVPQCVLLWGYNGA